MRDFMARLIPFILLGVAIVAFAFGLILITYLLVFGAIIGFILFVAMWIKERFFSSKHLVKSPKKERHGRTIDHE